MCRSGPSPCLSSATFFATSPFKNTEGCHSEEVMVFEATYLVAVLTPGHMSACCGQNAAQISKVLRPTNSSNGIFMPSLAENARMGHPQREWCSQRSLKVGHPPR